MISPFNFSHQTPASISLLLHTCCMPNPSRTAWFYYPNSIWCRVWIMKFNTQFLLVFSYLQHLLKLFKKTARHSGTSWLPPVQQLRFVLQQTVCERQLQPAATNCSYKLQLQTAEQTAVTNYSYKLQLQTAATNCSYKLQLQTAATNCRYKLQLQTAVTNCSYKLQLQTARLQFKCATSTKSWRLFCWARGHYCCLPQHVVSPAVLARGHSCCLS